MRRDKHKGTRNRQISDTSTSDGGQHIENIPRAPRIYELTGVDMMHWEEDIARYRADRKGYAYTKEKTTKRNYKG